LSATRVTNNSVGVASSQNNAVAFALRRERPRDDRPAAIARIIREYTQIASSCRTGPALAELLHHTRQYRVIECRARKVHGRERRSYLIVPAKEDS
jgi:hypothetical protein